MDESRRDAEVVLIQSSITEMQGVRRGRYGLIAWDHAPVPRKERN